MKSLGTNPEKVGPAVPPLPLTIYLAADHRGFELKEELKSWLTDLGHIIIDLGNDHLEPEDDYVDFGIAIARRLTSDLSHGADPLVTLGIGICGSGAGIAIAANRLRNIRAATSTTPDHATHIRENDHVNVLSLASDSLALSEAQTIIQAFLEARPLRQEKYLRRVKKLDAII